MHHYCGIYCSNMKKVVSETWRIHFYTLLLPNHFDNIICKSFKRHFQEISLLQLIRFQDSFCVYLFGLEALVPSWQGFSLF